jgi:eukaryotic-like serine/threonine-protein kinase
MISDAALRHLQEVADRPDLAGTPYEIRGTIGRGGMGTIYLAWDRDLEREVALKVVSLPEEGGELAERMLREARILARLEHPGIVPVHDVGTLPDGRVFYAMKRVRGSRLDEAARTVPLPERLRMFQRICEAVAFAHAHGVIHRDLKPENVMVGPFGEVLVMDWGVAKTLAVPSGDASAEVPLSRKEGREAGRGVRGEGFGEGGPTVHGTILGTPGYMAPEQERGEVDRIDERTDVWALGAILGFLLADSEVPRPLEAIRKRAMAAEPEARYPGVEALSADLSRYLAGLPVGAYRESLFERTGRFVRKYRTPILLVLAYLVMRALLLIWLGR